MGQLGPRRLHRPAAAGRDGTERTQETWAHIAEVRYRAALA
ncbi:MAG: hypothetical protein ACRDL4_06290 [Thermoleophilaceae bacterium]